MSLGDHGTGTDQKYNSAGVKERRVGNNIVYDNRHASKDSVGLQP